jgi:hypothetical protein
MIKSILIADMKSTRRNILRVNIAVIVLYVLTTVVVDELKKMSSNA